MSPHGTRTRYNLHRCRCAPCTAANTRHRQEQRAGVRRSVPSGIVRAHLEALFADGWHMNELARHLGYDRSTLRHIVSGRRQWTASLTAEDVLSVPLSGENAA